MKNKHIAQSQWGTAHASTSVIFTQRTSQWQISPMSPWRALVLSQNVHMRACVFCWGRGRRRRGAHEPRKRRKGKEWRDGWGQFGGLGVLIIHCSVVGSELAISSRLYPCLMIWAVPLSLSLPLLWPNKEKREGKDGASQHWLCHIYH